MKVLFAVSNENITTSVISKYQQKYKEIVTSKNVYYFNAIIKELQNDRTYDAIVIGEDLEPISNNNYDVIDKFIVEKLDSISDEASKSNGEDIPIIFICSDRRTKSDQLLRSLFSMGIYNALVGNDRSLDKVCSLINKPRSKKEAKKYYMIDNDDSIEYEPTNDELVSEEQLRNILTYYKKIGNDEKKCIQAFESISKQYNNAQLRLIIKILPMEVKAILEEGSPIYQKLMENGTVLSNGKYSEYTKNNPRQPGKLDFIEKNISTKKLTQPVIIPSNINFLDQKVENQKPQVEQKNIQQVLHPNTQLDKRNVNSYIYNSNNNISNNNSNNNSNNINQQQNRNIGYSQFQSRYGTVQPYNPYNNLHNDLYNNSYNNSYNPYFKNDIQKVNTTRTNVSIENKLAEKNQMNLNNQDNVNQNNINQNNVNQDNVNQNNINQNNVNLNSQPEKSNIENNYKTNSSVQPEMQNEVATPIKRKRGRPKKNAAESTNVVSTDVGVKRKRGRPKKVEKIENLSEKDENVQNSAIENFPEKGEIAQNSAIENFPEKDKNVQNSVIENLPEKDENVQNSVENNINKNAQNNNNFDLFNLSIDVPDRNINNKNDIKDIKSNQNFEEDKYAFLRSDSSENESLIKDNKYVPENENSDFVIAGNGKIVSFVGATKNGTSFIVNCLALLLANDGIKVAILDCTKNKNSYYLFTDNDSEKVKVAANSMKKLSDGICEGLNIKNNLFLFTSVPDENIDEKLNKNNVLNTLSQNFDIVMMDCDLHSDSTYFSNSDEVYLVQSMDVFTIQPLTKFLSDYKNIIDVKKLHTVINKYVKLKKLDYKMVIAGMSKYNDPSMALQRDLFDAKNMTCNLVPFDLKTYSSYLEAIALCKINLNEFSNDVIDSLYELKSRVYPLMEHQGENRKNSNSQNSISNNVQENFLNGMPGNTQNNFFNNMPNNMQNNFLGNMQNNMQNNKLNGFNKKDSNKYDNTFFSNDINSTLDKMRKNKM